MLGLFNYKTLEELSIGKGLSRIQNVFNTFIHELEDNLKIQPIYPNILIKIIDKESLPIGKNISILDFGVNRIIKNTKLIIEVPKNKFLPFILFREACYSFLPNGISQLVKICINQIVENNLIGVSTSKEWKKFIRDSLVNRDFIYSQFDKLKKFFKIEAEEPFESSTQFFFKEMRENIELSKNNNLNRFYDIIFENYAYKTSRSIFNSDIIKTLRILIQIFYETKTYLNLTDYQTKFKEFKEKKNLELEISLRKFTENMQWINKCSSISPSYEISFDSIDLHLIIGIIKFNPLLERIKIKTVMEQWLFYHSPKLCENSFTTELFLFFIVPRLYLKDLLNYFDSLKDSGFVLYNKFYQVSSKTSLINLNYFMNVSNVIKIIEPSSIKYRSNYEIETVTEYPPIPHQSPLSLFDFTLLDRIKYVSVTGLTFDKRIETLNAIKDDIKNELRKQKTFNSQFKDNLSKLNKYKHQFLQLLEENEKQGFLYFYSQLNNILNYIDLIDGVLNEHSEILNIYQLKTFIDEKATFQIIDDQLILQNENINKIVFHHFLPLYFQSKSSFREEVEKYQNYYDILNTCKNLKILDLRKIKKIVSESKLADKIYETREKIYKELFKTVSSYKITNEKIESTIRTFLNHDPPVLNPLLINTIFTSTFAKYYPELILKYTPEVYNQLQKLKPYFPRIFIYKMIELKTNKNFINISIYFLNIKEKKLFLSVLYSYFNDYIITIKRFFWRGFVRIPELLARDFYDFKSKQFFYSEDIFSQLQKFSEKILGEKLVYPDYSMIKNINELFWTRKQNMDSLVNVVKERISRQKIDFNSKELKDLSDFTKNIETFILNRTKFIDLKIKQFFNTYIKSINFLPAFQKFGFSQYYLYFRPFFYKSPTFEIDFRILFANSFQKIKYPAVIEQNPAIYGKYIFPLRTPNKSYLNWLVKSKKIVSEYCLFYNKKFYEIVHFNRNLTNENWSYSSLRFKTYMQDVLFNPYYEPKISGIREFDICEISETEIYGYYTKEFEDLSNIYNTQSIDIKSFLGTKQYSKINTIIELIKKKLIFPYISLKNLDFQDKVSIILPDTKQEFNEKIMKVFSFFNMCRIYEIEGEFFIYGFEEEKTFENGLLIEIWFPKCELDEFFNVFDLIFQYFEIKHYLILTDLINGKTLLKSIYGNLNFLKDYNPLLNLKWNDKDKIWMNHKLFNEKFEPIYPDLIKKENE